MDNGVITRGGYLDSENVGTWQVIGPERVLTCLTIDYSDDNRQLSVTLATTVPVRVESPYFVVKSVSALDEEKDVDLSAVLGVCEIELVHPHLDDAMREDAGP